jgi:hypothetical protein
MVSSIWVTAISLVGVVIGGALSMFSQRFAERSAADRHKATIYEGRRGERLSYLIAFIGTAQQAERLAINVHQHGATGDMVVERTEATLDDLWVRLRAVQLICPSEVSDAAYALAVNVHNVVRQGPGDQSVRDFLRPQRGKFMSAAYDDLEQVPSGR